MNSIAKRVLNDACNCESYWNLSDAERFLWMIERAFTLGVKSAHGKLNLRRGRKHSTHRKDHPQKSS